MEKPMRDMLMVGDGGVRKYLMWSLLIGSLSLSQILLLLLHLRYVNK